MTKLPALALVFTTVFTMVFCACGGSYPAARSAEKKPAGTGKAGKAHKGSVDIARAALPFHVLRSKGGQEIATTAFMTELARQSAVCIGESHPNPHHHWAQLEVLQSLVELSGQREVALGMEMFQRPYQAVLNDYLAGRIDEGAMLSRTGWQERWGYDFSMYRPMVELALERKMPILALNVATELRKKLSRKGIDGLTPKERARVPELDLDNVDHKAWFDDTMASVGGPHGSAHGSGKKADPKEAEDRTRRIYTTQVLWDETMADTAAKWLAARKNRMVIIIAGSGHCHDSAIVNRLRRRGVDRVVSIKPVVDTGEGKVAAELAQPTTDYLVVMTMAK